MNPDEHGPTAIRSALLCLADLEAGGGLPLDEWESNLVRMLSTQARFSDREKLAVLRIVGRHATSGEFADALARRKAANSETNHARTVKCLEAHSDGKNDVSGSLWCVVCNRGQNLHYRINRRGEFTAICETANCIRLYQRKEGYPGDFRFANIMPQDIGTFLVESDGQPGTFHAVDAVEQTCSCEDFRFRNDHSGGYQCKHLAEVNAAVFLARIF